MNRAFQLMAKSVEDIRAKEQRKRLIVSVEPSFATAWLVPRLETFRNNHRDVDVLIDSSLRIVDLGQGEADLAIRFGRTPSKELMSLRLFDEVLSAFCSPILTRGERPLKQLDDLQHVTLLHWDLTQYEWVSATRRWMDWNKWLTQASTNHVSLGSSLIFSDYNLALQAAIAGQGIILGSKPILAKLVEVGLLCDPFNIKVTTDIGYDLVTTERAKLRPEVQFFLDWIVAEVSSSLTDHS